MSGRRRSSFALGGPKDLPPRKREILDTVVGTRNRFRRTCTRTWSR